MVRRVFCMYNTCFCLKVRTSTKKRKHFNYKDLPDHFFFLSFGNKNPRKCPQQVFIYHFKIGRNFFHNNLNDIFAVVLPGEELTPAAAGGGERKRRRGCDGKQLTVMADARGHAPLHQAHAPPLPVH